MIFSANVKQLATISYEIQHWYKNYQFRLPIFEPGDKQRLEDLTDRVPLLLRGLLQDEFRDKKYQEVEERFLLFKDIEEMMKWAVDFTEKKKRNSSDYFWNRFIK